MKKILTGVLALLLISTTLVGCSKPKDEGSALPSADEKVTISVSWWGSDNRHEAMQKVVELYQAANPNVTVEVNYGAWDGWQTKILTQLSGKTESDVIQVNYNWVHSFGKGQNVFYNLNELKEFIDLSNWDADYLKAMEVGGEQAAVPHGMTGRVQLVNDALFTANGLTFPTTYEEVIAAAKVIGANNTATGAENQYVLMNVGKQSTDLFIAQILFDTTGKVMQENGKINYTEEEVKAALDIYKSLEDAGAMPTFAQEDPIQNESNPVWTSGRVGAVYEWAGTLDKYTNAYKGGGVDSELAIGKYISSATKPNIYVKPNLGYAVSKNSKNPAVAADFINFMFTNEEAVKALGTSLGISSNTVTNEIQMKEGMIVGKVAEAYALLDTYDQTVMDPYFEDENVRGKRYEVVESFRSGEVDSATAAKQFIEKQQEELDKLYK